MPNGSSEPPVVKKTKRKSWIFLWLLLLPAAGIIGNHHALADPVSPASFQQLSPAAVQTNPSETPQSEPVPTGKKTGKETDKKRLKFLLVVNLIFIITAFTIFLIISLIRFSRFQRQRLQIGKKAEPTEYIDAWSRYRLDEKDMELETPPDNRNPDDNHDG